MWRAAGLLLLCCTFRAAIAGDTGATLYGPGDTVDVVVISEGQRTNEWHPAIIVGTRADGAYDLVLRGGKAVTPALGTGIREEHLRPRRPCALDILPEAALELAEETLDPSRKGNSASRSTDAAAASSDTEKQLQQILSALGMPDSAAAAAVTAAAAASSTAATSSTAGPDNDKLEKLAKKLDKMIISMQREISSKEKNFDELRGRDAAKSKLIALRDEISKSHQQLAGLLRNRDLETKIDPKSLRMKIGERVFAEWNGRGAWYPGRVKTVAEGPAYQIEYDDGDQEALVPPVRVRPVHLQQHIASVYAKAAPTTPASSLAVGDHVLADYKGKGKFLPGTISGVDSSSEGTTFSVKYNNGNQEHSVPEPLVRKISSDRFKVGDRVRGAYLGPRGGHGQLYPGTISRVDKNELYSIAYDDGDLEDNVPKERIVRMDTTNAENAQPERNMQLTTVMMVQGADGKMKMQKVNLGSVLGADNSEVMRRLEAVLRGEDPSKAPEIVEETPGRVQKDPKRSTIMRLASTY